MILLLDWRDPAFTRNSSDADYHDAIRHNVSDPAARSVRAGSPPRRRACPGSNNNNTHNSNTNINDTNTNDTTNNKHTNAAVAAATIISTTTTTTDDDDDDDDDANNSHNHTNTNANNHNTSGSRATAVHATGGTPQFPLREFRRARVRPVFKSSIWRNGPSPWEI